MMMNNCDTDLSNTHNFTSQRSYNIFTFLTLFFDADHIATIQKQSDGTDNEENYEDDKSHLSKLYQQEQVIYLF